MKIEELESIKSWEQFKEKASAGNELIIFKYSPICGTSLYAENVFNSWAEKLKMENKIKISMINVIDQKQLSNHIAKELSVIHQSPQIIWLNNNLLLKFTASHLEINEDEMNKNLTNIK